MDQLKEQLFPSEFILDYIQEDAGNERFLAYVLFRFFSFAAEMDTTLSSAIKKQLEACDTDNAFSCIEDYLQADYYFAPSLYMDSYEPLYLYAAICMTKNMDNSGWTFIDFKIAELCPVIAGLSYEDTNVNLAALLQTGTDFYAALYLAATRSRSVLPALLPKFTEAYQEDFHFTSEDYILFDFMDEYFEQKHCLKHPSFMELVNTLVAATLNYHNTDFGSLLEQDISQMQSGISSRFAGGKRLGNVCLSDNIPTEKGCHMLAEMFRYAAIYELRNNLFDFHLEDDKLITLDNWKENLRWHYVQYANVYNMALDSFYASLLSRKLLKRQLEDNLTSA